jgi:predicted dehydrogenase
MASRKKYAVVGTGARARMYINALAGTYSDSSELVALCDMSQTRMDWHNRQLQTIYNLDPFPTYPADQFDQMIADTQPDTVIVTTIDATHHLYINRAMELGCNVISEKPLTTKVESLHSIFDTIERTGRSVRVAFNYRYAPAYTKLRELVMQGAIGKPLCVDFSWMLDTRHGADYFRRWHREKANSGGLMVHKATHHFDLIN